MSDKRRPGPRVGVMAYVAELQQLDAAQPPADEPTPPEASTPAPVPPTPVALTEPAPVEPARTAQSGTSRTSRPGTAQVETARTARPETAQVVAAQVVAAQVVAARGEIAGSAAGSAEPRGRGSAEPIDITPGALVPPVSSEGSRRRLRFGLLAGAALAAVVAGGVGYAALNPPGADVAAPKHDGSVPAPADGASTPGVPAVPGLAPIAARTAGPGTSAPATTAGSVPGVAGGPIGTVGVPATPTVPHGPTGPAQTGPPQTRPAETGPPGTTDPDETPPGQDGPPAGHGPARPLTGSFTHTADLSADGISGYAGSIRIDNPRPRAAPGWHVTLTVPGGNSVYGDGSVNVAQHGERVMFTSAGGAATVPAGGSTTFAFTVGGTLGAEPVDCAINGHPCA